VGFRPSGITGELRGQSYSLASDAVQGAYSLTLTSTPSGLSVGDSVFLDEDTFNNSGDPNAWPGPRGAHPPLNGYTNTTACGTGKTMAYANIVNRNAVIVEAFDYYNEFIGNVLGMSGQTSTPQGVDNCFTSFSGFASQVITHAEWSGQSQNASWWVGPNHAAASVSPYQWTFDTSSSQP